MDEKIDDVICSDSVNKPIRWYAFHAVQILLQVLLQLHSNSWLLGF
jgi:hypothetical protein